jgi:hypothetical protein
MKLYTVFTESHRSFFENYFFKTLPFEPRLELRILFKPQICSGEFLSKGWNQTMAYKVDCFIQAAKETPDNEIFMFSDPDIQFFKPFYDDILNHMRNYEAVFQNDYFGGINTGFFAMRSNPNIRGFLNTVKHNLANFNEEQHAFNSLVQHFDKLPKIKFNWKKLPLEYWTYGEKVKELDTNPVTYSIWNGDKTFDIPDNIIMHHANWTKTFYQKKEILDLVRKKHCLKNKVTKLFDI